MEAPERTPKTTEVRTPIGLVAGSLGSGKTTLLRKILERPDRRYAILMNEYGELAIDGEVIRGKNVEIAELVGGCVCCSLTGELEAAVEEIIDRVHPEYILLEATGVAEADALVYEVEERIPRVRIDSVVCIVDADASIRFPSVGYAGRSQLEAADIVLINKIDLVTEADIEKVIARVREFAPDAAILKTIRCAAEAGDLFGLPASGRAAFEPARVGEIFGSFTFTTQASLDKRRFHEAVLSLPPSVFRAKGFVRFRDGSSLFNYVAGRIDFEEFPSPKTELVFIGPKVEYDRDAIAKLIKNCEE